MGVKDSHTTENLLCGAEIDESVIEAVIERIVEVIHPQQIVLFGSWARREGQPDSDLDLLVVHDTC